MRLVTEKTYEHTVIITGLSQVRSMVGENRKFLKELFRETVVIHSERVSPTLHELEFAGNELARQRHIPPYSVHLLFTLTDTLEVNK